MCEWSSNHSFFFLFQFNIYLSKAPCFWCGQENCCCCRTQDYAPSLITPGPLHSHALVSTDTDITEHKQTHTFTTQVHPWAEACREKPVQKIQRVKEQLQKDKSSTRRITNRKAFFFLIVVCAKQQPPELLHREQILKPNCYLSV